jgi:ribose transport system substrate-binding protein
MKRSRSNESGPGQRPVRIDRRRFLRLSGGLVVVGASSGILVACGNGDDAGEASEPVGGQIDTSSYATDSPWRVGRAGFGDVNDWMTFLTAHYDYAFNVKHADLFEDVLVTDAQVDPSKQVADIEDLLTQGIDLLFVEPVSESAAVGAVRQAIQADVPVVLASTGINSDDFTARVTRNNYRDGQLKGEWAVEKLGGGGRLIALMGAPGTSYAADVWRGVEDVFAEHPDMEVLGMEHANWSVPDAKAATEAFLTQHDEIDLVLSDGGQMALGALQAFQEAGRPMPPVTADDWNGWLRAASENDEELEFYAVSGSANLGETAVDIAVNVLRGEPVAKLNDAPFVTFEEDELEDWYRPDLVDAYWGHHSLPDDFVDERFAR